MTFCQSNRLEINVYSLFIAIQLPYFHTKIIRLQTYPALPPIDCRYHWHCLSCRRLLFPPWETSACRQSLIVQDLFFFRLCSKLCSFLLIFLNCQFLHKKPYTIPFYPSLHCAVTYLVKSILSMLRSDWLSYY